MIRFHLYGKREYGLEHVTSLEAETKEDAYNQIINGMMLNKKGFDKKYILSDNAELDQDYEEEKYREALRATCSLCVLEGRCVCGELDPLQEEDIFFNEQEE